MIHNIDGVNWIIYYIVLINLLCFIAFGIDKYKAKTNRWRIKESSLILLNILGGSIGGILSMILFKHKTKKMKFVIGVPVILLAQIVIFYILNNLTSIN